MRSKTKSVAEVKQLLWRHVQTGVYALDVARLSKRAAVKQGFRRRVFGDKRRLSEKCRLITLA